MTMHQAYIGLGGNLGNVRRAFALALAQLDQAAIFVQRVSSLYHTRALVADGTYDPSVPNFLNAVAQVATERRPVEVLDVLLNIENKAGRVRTSRWASRTLDLDLLVFGDVRIDTAQLRVPHPELLNRAFVLHPLAEVAPSLLLEFAGVRAQANQWSKTIDGSCILEVEHSWAGAEALISRPRGDYLRVPSVPPQK